MDVNALTDVEWVKTTSGAMSVQEALVNAHRISGLDLTLPALQVSSTLRLLCQVYALLVRKMGGTEKIRNNDPLDPLAINEAITEIGSAANLFDPEQPFMQRPPASSKPPLDKSLQIGPGNHPVKKLFPFMPSTQAENFWSFSVEAPPVLHLPEAVLALVTYHHFSMAGNNSYAESKCAMGAPGIRFPGKDYTATEIVWQGETLLRTLGLNTPEVWIYDGGLPAWADRTGERSSIGTYSEMPRLWVASWSSNAAVGYWAGTDLAGVRVGGVPANWLPLPTTDKKLLKAWWDNRNTQDPFYLYITDKSGEAKAQRLDLERDLIDLAVEWNANNKAEQLGRHSKSRVRAPNDEDQVVFFRHLVGGTASSPSIRASEILVGDTKVWAPDEEVAEAISGFSNLLNELHRDVTSPFRRSSSTSETNKKAPAVLDPLQGRRADASAYFWREMASVFTDFVDQKKTTFELSSKEAWKIQNAAMQAFDQTVEPYLYQYRDAIFYVRGSVSGRIRHRVNPYVSDKDQ